MSPRDAQTRITDVLLDRYLAGDLSPAQRRRVEEACRDEPAVRARLTELERDREAFLREVAPEDFARHVSARLTVEKASRRRRWPRMWMLMPSAAVAMAGLLVAVFHERAGGPPPLDEPRPSDVAWAPQPAPVAAPVPSEAPQQASAAAEGALDEAAQPTIAAADAEKARDAEGRSAIGGGAADKKVAAAKPARQAARRSRAAEPERDAFGSLGDLAAGGGRTGGTARGIGSGAGYGAGGGGAGKGLGGDEGLATKRKAEVGPPLSRTVAAPPPSPPAPATAPAPEPVPSMPAALESAMEERPEPAPPAASRAGAEEESRPGPGKAAAEEPSAAAPSAAQRADGSVSNGHAAALGVTIERLEPEVRRVSSGETVRAGSSLRLRLDVQAPAYVLVLGVRPGEPAHRYFASGASPLGARGERTLVLPLTVRAAERAVGEGIYVLVSAEPINPAAVRIPAVRDGALPARLDFAGRQARFVLRVEP